MARTYDRAMSHMVSVKSLQKLFKAMKNPRAGEVGSGGGTGVVVHRERQGGKEEHVRRSRSMAASRIVIIDRDDNDNTHEQDEDSLLAPAHSLSMKAASINEMRLKSSLAWQPHHSLLGISHQSLSWCHPLSFIIIPSYPEGHTPRSKTHRRWTLYGCGRPSKPAKAPPNQVPLYDEEQPGESAQQLQPWTQRERQKRTIPPTPDKSHDNAETFDIMERPATPLDPTQAPPPEAKQNFPTAGTWSLYWASCIILMFPNRTGQTLAIRHLTTLLFLYCHQRVKPEKS
ncbi:hypothetical protein EI94DRAFT_1706227 [Lactarius quietus]|nr:hypothetical protein EI94DRAFT_1706227 [Lactarius quietus]